MISARSSILLASSVLAAAIAIAGFDADAVAQGASPSYAPGQPAPAPDLTYHRHEGFYLRTFLGVGGTAMNAKDADIKVSGGGGTFGLAIGGAVSDQLIVYGELFDDVANNPTVEIGGTKQETSDTSAGVVGLGVGLAFYTPSNFYLSGTAAASRLTVQQNNNEVGRSKTGLGFSLMAGKEWWVSANWGLGVAGQLYLGSMKDRGEGAPRWSAAALGVVFSATYN